MQLGRLERRKDCCPNEQANMSLWFNNAIICSYIVLLFQHIFDCNSLKLRSVYNKTIRQTTCQEGSVTIFGEISQLWQYFEPTCTNLLCYKANFLSCKWPKLEKVILSSRHIVIRPPLNEEAAVGPLVSRDLSPLPV